MEPLISALIDFQTALVAALLHVLALAVALVGLGMVSASVAPSFAYRVKRLGLQTIGACLVVIAAHAIMIEVYGPDVPPALLVGFYAITAVLLLHGLLNLVFGPAVGNSVIATLLSSLILALLFAAIRPIRFVRDLFG